MPSLKELRNRIASVKATQKITKAMQMVAAAKLRRAQMAAEAARPYATRMETVLANLATALKGREGGPPLMVGTGKDAVHLLVVCTAERGLCGAFNSAIVRLAREHINRLLADGKQVKILCVGKKGFDQLKRLYAPLIIEMIDFRSVRQLSFEHAEKVSDRVLEPVRRGRLRRGDLVLFPLQVGDQPNPNRAADHPGHDPGRDCPRRQTLSAAPSTNTSPTRPRSSPSFCPSTSPCRSSRRCSRTRRRSRARA